MDELKGEQLILKEMLNSTTIAEKIEALKRVIISMTIGKNVSSLFQSVIKCLELPNLETKKLIYLYIINNSKSCPDDALMIVNQFCKDARDKRPIIRALAIRTMGYLRVAKLNEYLIDPLLDGLRDQNPYVRKTAVICVPKVLEVSRDLIVAKQIPALLNEMLESDANASVIASALISLKEISGIVGRPLVLEQKTVVRLFSFSAAFSEWEQVYVFDILAELVSAGRDVGATDEARVARERSQLLDAVRERLVPKLSHCNRSLVVSTAKLLFVYARRLGLPPEEAARLFAKAVRSLVSLINSDEETSLVVMRFLLSANEQDPKLELLSEPLAFQCRNEDPLYIKVLKLKLMRKSARAADLQPLFDELASYFRSADLSFAVEAVQTFFRVARRFPAKPTFARLSEKLAEISKHLFETQSWVVVEEIVAGQCDFLAGLLDKSPLDAIRAVVLDTPAFLAFIARVCDSSRQFKTDRGKIGFYGLLLFLPHSGDEKTALPAAKPMAVIQVGVEDFFKECEEVQLAILTALVRLYLEAVENIDSLLTSLFERITAESHSPLIRDQAFFYWRLLTRDAELARSILFDTTSLPAPADPDSLLDEGEAAPAPRRAPIELKHLGTFVNLLETKADPRLPLFLLNDTYQFRLKLKEKAQTMNSLEKRLVHERDKSGRKGRTGFEVSARVEPRRASPLLLIDVKNTSNLVHEITGIRVQPNHGGFQVEPAGLAAQLGRCIQKNEICMLELPLAADPARATKLQSAVSSLALEVVFETNYDEYSFKVPFLLNLMLWPEKLPAVSEQSIEELKASRGLRAVKFELESYEENLAKFTKVFESNRVFRTPFGGYYYLAVEGALVATFKLEKKSDVELGVSLWMLDELFAALVQGLISHLIAA